MIVITTILKAILVLIGSWAMIHLLALFGFFLVIGYPIFLMLAPNRFPCLACRVFKKNPMEEQNIWTLFQNAAIIFILTVLSLGIVLVESKILAQMGIPPTKKTVSFVIPTKNQKRLGEIFPMKIEIVGVETAINAVQADVSYDPTILEVIGISTEESFASIFIQKEIDNEAGYARLSGGLPNPGFFSDKGNFGTVLFRGVAPGLAQVEFLPTSMVLANDGSGSNVLKEFTSAAYIILPETITEKEHSQQEVLLTSNVLGRKDDEAKMVFYDTGDQVLGSISKLEEEPQQKPGYLREILNKISELDDLIMTTWSKIIDTVLKLRINQRV